MKMAFNNCPNPRDHDRTYLSVLKDCVFKWSLVSIWCVAKGRGCYISSSSIFNFTCDRRMLTSMAIASAPSAPSLLLMQLLLRILSYSSCTLRTVQDVHDAQSSSSTNLHNVQERGLVHFVLIIVYPPSNLGDWWFHSIKFQQKGFLRLLLLWYIHLPT